MFYFWEVVEEGTPGILMRDILNNPFVVGFMVFFIVENVNSTTHIVAIQLV